MVNNMRSLSTKEAAELPPDDVLQVLHSGPSGLTSTESSVRRSTFGFNEFSVKAARPLWKKYLDQFSNPFILLLLASAVISVMMGQLDDAASISFAIIIVVSVGFVQEYRSEKTLERLGALLPPSCHCLRDGSVSSLLARYLIPGDVVELNVGDRVPADLRLIEVHELSIDESNFTGETEPVSKYIDQSQSNTAFLGTLVANGRGRGVVISTGDSSQFGEMFKMMEKEEKPRTPLQESMDKLGKQLSIYSLAVIALIMLIGVWKGRPALDMFNVGVSLAVAAIPEGLPIVVTVTLALGVMRMANRNAIVKRLPTVEALGCVDFICSDKTGTLTTNCLSVYGIASPSIIISEEPVSLYENIQTLNTEDVKLTESSVICNNAEINQEGIIGNPTEKALLTFAQRFGLDSVRSRFRRIDELPFSSDRKFMSVTCKKNNGDDTMIKISKGALENVIKMCSHIGNNVMSEEMIRKVLRCNEKMASKGLRVLAFSEELMDSSKNKNVCYFLGLVGLRDPPRSQVKDSIKMLKKSKVEISMITGDSKETALSIAETLDIHSPLKHSLSGNEIDSYSDSDLRNVAERVSVYYRASPRHKLRIIKALQSNGHVVAMTGDGVNDGVAVKKADVGISMGLSGTDVCKEAADIILLNDDFSTLVGAVEEGKCIFYNIRNFVRFQLSTSIAALFLLSLSTLLDIPNPLNPMQILWINVIMDGPPAQSLGLEPVDHEVIKRPPRKKSEQILTKALIKNVLVSAVVIISGTLFVFKQMMVDGRITARDTTMTFTCFVFFDMFNALSCRSQERLIWDIGFFTNKYFCTAVAGSIIGQLAVIYFPPLQYIFQTEALSFKDIILLAILSSSVFFISEGKKYCESKRLSLKSLFSFGIRPQYSRVRTEAKSFGV
uniref:Calcium-transporting ATPase n=1 Tax=Lepeophtheirus salmonis TaxID=72036 RepID=A0A0K2URG4_LEPSM